jgi:hypothetical protein
MICPLLRACRAQVSFDHHQQFCTNVTEDAYKRCEHYKSQTAGAKTPSEWTKLTAPT